VCAHPQSDPHGSAPPSVEPLRQSVAFSLCLGIFLQGREVNLLKKYYDFKLEFCVTKNRIKTSGTGPLKQQEWKEWIVQSSGTLGFGGFSTI
jgi:hypothetical protein